MVTPKSKREFERPAAFAKGGSDRMFKQQAAGPAAPARTGKAQSTAPGARAASGGAPQRGHSTAAPAKPGHSGPARKER